MVISPLFIYIWKEIITIYIDRWGDIMMQRFTDDAQRVLSLAQEAALELGHDYVGTEHVLIGLTKVKKWCSS